MIRNGETNDEAHVCPEVLSRKTVLIESLSPKTGAEFDSETQLLKTFFAYGPARNIEFKSEFENDCACACARGVIGRAIRSVIRSVIRKVLGIVFGSVNKNGITIILKLICTRHPLKLNLNLKT